MKIGVGKFRGFMRITNDFGQFNMLALDQRNSLEKMISEKHGAVHREDLVRVKRAILKNLSSMATAVLVDGEYGFPENLKYVHHSCGIILSAEKSGYVTDEKGTNDRLSVLYREDVVSFAKKCAADAVKLLVYWSQNASEKAKEHQRNIVEEIGKACLKEDMLYILEIITYGVSNEEKNSAVLEAMREFNSDRYGVDLFKVEAFKEEKELEKNDVYEASNGKPWVILSGGVDIEKFKDIMRYNARLGASGFLAGRVIWKKAPDFLKVPAEMDLHLASTGKYNLEILKMCAAESVPFFDTPHFGGLENVEII